MKKKHMDDLGEELVQIRKDERSIMKEMEDLEEELIELYSYHLHSAISLLPILLFVVGFIYAFLYSSLGLLLIPILLFGGVFSLKCTDWISSSLLLSFRSLSVSNRGNLYEIINLRRGLKKLQSKLERKKSRRRELRSDILLLLPETELDEKLDQLDNEEVEEVLRLEDHR